MTIQDHRGDPTFANETFDVVLQDVRKYAAALGRSIQASADPSTVEVPLTFYLALGMARGRIRPRAELAPDGMPGEEPLGERRFMAAGSEVWFGERMSIGDRVTVEQELVAHEQKQGRSATLDFVTVERRYVRQDGALVVRERYTRVAR